jgi:hypothetical protein
MGVVSSFTPTYGTCAWQILTSINMASCRLQLTYRN